MSIILVGSQKGGVGKTTISVNLASLMATKGKDICLVDADVQGSSSEWAAERETKDAVKSITCVTLQGDIKKSLLDLNKRFEIIIVDAVGRDSKELRSAMMVANVFVSPFKPSQIDLNTIPKVIEIFGVAKMMNEALQGLFVQNLCSTLPTMKEADEAELILSEIDEAKLSPVRLCDRKVYRDSFSEGFGVHELVRTKAKATKSEFSACNEISWLLDEIESLL